MVSESVCAKAPPARSARWVAMSTQIVRLGGCACGQLRFSASGSPRRGGLCHCLTCRKAHAAAFNPFLVFAPDQVSLSGTMTAWESSPGYVRYFCGRCGSRVLAINQTVEGGEEYELSLGSFDETGLFAPQYESWTSRREPWLPDLALPQFVGNRDTP